MKSNLDNSQLQHNQGNIKLATVKSYRSHFCFGSKENRENTSVLLFSNVRRVQPYYDDVKLEFINRIA